jgi:hypothetical protein
MALIIKSFRQILKQRKGKYYKPRSKKVCYKCGKPGHFIAKCPLSSDSDRENDKRGNRKEKKKYYKKKGGDAHVCREWDSDESSTDSSMCLGVPFIAPRQLGAIGDILGRLILPSVGWRTGQSGAPSDSHCSCPVRDLLPFLVHPTVADSRQLAYRSVRCPLPTVGASTRRVKIARSTVGAVDHWLTG